MDTRELTATAEYLVDLGAGDDWRGGVERAAAEAGVDGGWFAGTGRVRDADLWHYDPERAEHRTVGFEEPLTVASCVGMVGTGGSETGDGGGDGDGDGDGNGAEGGDASTPVARPYAVLARPSGQALAGYLNAATAAEGTVYLRAFGTEFDLGGEA